MFMQNKVLIRDTTFSSTHPMPILLFLVLAGTNTDIFIAYVIFFNIGYRNQKSMYDVSWLTSFIK